MTSAGARAAGAVAGPTSGGGLNGGADRGLVPLIGTCLGLGQFRLDGLPVPLPLRAIPSTGTDVRQRDIQRRQQLSAGRASDNAVTEYQGVPGELPIGPADGRHRTTWGRPRPGGCGDQGRVQSRLRPVGAGTCSRSVRDAEVAEQAAQGQSAVPIAAAASVACVLPRDGMAPEEQPVGRRIRGRSAPALSPAAQMVNTCT